MLRYRTRRRRRCSPRRPRPQVLFNYFGRFPGGQDGDWTPAPEARSPGRPRRRARPAVPAHARRRLRRRAERPGAAGDLDAHRGRPQRRRRGHARREWVAALRELTAQAARRGAGGLSPRDLSTVTLDQEQIDGPGAEPGNRSQDIWPLVAAAGGPVLPRDVRRRRARRLHRPDLAGLPAGDSTSSGCERRRRRCSPATRPCAPASPATGLRGPCSSSPARRARRSRSST